MAGFTDDPTASAGKQPFRTAKQGDVFRVMKGGEPQPEIDGGGFRSRQEALDAATQANVEQNPTDTGSKMQNRRNRLDRALEKSMGR